MKKFSRFLAGLILASFWSITVFAQGNFIRGDADCDGTVDSSDVAAVNTCVFGGACPCRDAADVNDDGILSPADGAFLLNYLNSGGAPPRLPFPDCGADPTADALSCLTSCCTANNHYQAWRVTDFAMPVFRTVSAVDQFMQDNLRLDTIQFLSNPAQKDTFRIIDNDDHLTWYRAVGRDTLLEVEFVNQFQRDTVLIDSVRYFLVPTTKSPHPPYDSLDHYKAYHIRNPQAFNRSTVISDQFIGGWPVSLMIPRYFLTPARKNAEPTYDMATHYVAYEFFPKRTLFSTRSTVDQFGGHNLRADSNMLLLVPTMKLSVRAPSFECSDGIDNDGDGLIDFPADCGCTDATDPTEAPNPPTECSDGIDNDGDGFIDFPADPECASICDNLEGVPPPDTGDNHYKTWSLQPLAFTGTAQVKDQFKTEQLQFQAIFALSNPVQKIVAGDTSNIFDPDDHLLWYSARGQRTVLEVDYVNQFESTTVRIDTVLALLVPATKQPHPPYDNLDHYKVYRIPTYPILNRQVQLQDQFDLTPEQITTLRPVYFLTPAQKNAEPVYDTVTHYVGYAISPTRSAPQTRTVNDQFGTHIVNIQNSQVLLVPTRKLAYRTPECGDGLDNDGDGFVDYPADCGCTSAEDFTEAPNPPTACSDGIDNDGDGLIDLADPDCADICDGVEGVSQPHYKTWTITPQSVSLPPVQVRDQFKTEQLTLTSIQLLSNPVQKIVANDTFNIVDPDDHLLWYQAQTTAPPSYLRVDYVNQFEDTSRVIQIGSGYFLVPAQKLPHPPYDSLDHYRAYPMQGTTLNISVRLQDQFDATPEQITFLFPQYFLTPAQKNAEPVYDTITHYVAYAISPPRTVSQTRTVIDQFGSRTVTIGTSRYLLVPTRKTGFGVPKCSDGLDNDGDGLIDYPADCGCSTPYDDSEAPNSSTQCNNGVDDDGDGLIDLADCGCSNPCDFTESPNPTTQCNDGVDNDGDGLIDLADPDCDNICDTSEVGEVSPILNHYKSWRTMPPMPFQGTVLLTDQFIKDDPVRLDSIDFLSNPARKVTPTDSTEILRPNDHLTWYRAFGRTFGREIQFRNQFGADTIQIDTLRYLLVPTQKLPHNPPVQLDHYKCYRIRDPRPFPLPVSLQDQFDPNPQFMDQLTPQYFCTPCQKNGEPVYDTVTHYVGYFFDPQPRTISPRVTIDQFGQRELIPRQSEVLLVPSDKTFVCPCAKGDINCDGNFSPADGVCLLNCVYLGGAAAPCVCDLCVADVNCDGTLSASDVVSELNRVYLGITTPPWCGL